MSDDLLAQHKSVVPMLVYAFNFACVRGVIKLYLKDSMLLLKRSISVLWLVKLTKFTRSMKIAPAAAAMQNHCQSIKEGVLYKPRLT